ncbi:hypothetical protein [Singulisphaera sp. PoT]|uniref:hypothetical protein n=1 Tax=Singulisphaera sp. PoT TaxID=3411797 RepID=UPI003BF5E214
MSRFLSAGDVLINPDTLTYAIVETDSEGLHLRLGFKQGEATSPAPAGELRLTGLEARTVLRWLRSHAEFLDAGGTATPHSPRKPYQASTPGDVHLTSLTNGLTSLRSAQSA